MGQKQACWAEVKGAALSYDDDFKNFLIDPNEARTQVRQARADRTMGSGIEAQIKVTNVGATFWSNLLERGRVNRKLSPREAQTIEICASYPRKIPTEFQCQQAVSVLECLKAEGFVEGAT